MILIYLDMFLTAQMLLMDVMNTSTILAWFQLLSFQFEFNQIKIFTIKDKASYLLQFDCRKIYFQHYLNDQHDDVLRRIFIRDIVDSRFTFLYNRSENATAPYLFNRSESIIETFLYNRNEISSLLDFEVVLPVGLIYNSNKLIADIERYKLPGMKYQIVIE
jgi:hypothetical protein